MSPKAKKYIKIIAGIISIPILAVIGLLIFATVTDFQPPETMEVEILSDNNQAIASVDTLSLVTWNIGYAGLGEGMDFFYDGGKQVRPSKDIFNTYLEGIGKTVEGMNDVDFILLQEVDLDSKRSHSTNEMEFLAGKLSGYAYGFGVNYKVHFVPQPLLDPLGNVHGGLVTYSRSGRKEQPGIAFLEIMDGPQACLCSTVASWNSAIHWIMEKSY